MGIDDWDRGNDIEFARSFSHEYRFYGASNRKINLNWWVSHFESRGLVASWKEHPVLNDTFANSPAWRGDKKTVIFFFLDPFRSLPDWRRHLSVNDRFFFFQDKFLRKWEFRIIVHLILQKTKYSVVGFSTK